jgi:hypothetical protein
VHYRIQLPKTQGDAKMTTDFRALCAELTMTLEYTWDEYTWDGRRPKVIQELIERARAALAQPELQAPTDEELLGIEDLETAWNAQADAFNSWDELGIDEIVWWAQRQALARSGRPAIEPVPVSEGLPGPEDCDAEGRCWWALHDGRYDHWKKVELMTALGGPWKPSHWLPYWALPVPNSN